MTQGLAHTVDGVGPPPRRPPTFAFSPTCLTSLRLKPEPRHERTQETA